MECFVQSTSFNVEIHASWKGTDYWVPYRRGVNRRCSAYIFEITVNAGYLWNV